MCETKHIIFDDDIIEIMYNNNLSFKPYLVRFTNYSNESYEMRADVADLFSIIEGFLAAVDEEKNLKPQA
jgi:hypothetical protein